MASARATAEKLLAKADVKIGGDRASDIQVHDERLFRRVLSGGSVGLGESLHPEHTNRDAEPSVHRVNLRFVFEKQEGNNFWGTSTGTSGTSERILGAIGRDGKSGVLINARGRCRVFLGPGG